MPSDSNGQANTEHLQSAGGVLVVISNHARYTVVLHRREPVEWRLPKGKLRPGETPRQAAVREVYEETGIRAAAGQLVGTTEYDYVELETAQVVHKQVLFYLMSVPRREPIQVEEATFDEGRWVSVAEAQRLLTFPNEQRIVHQAAAYPLGSRW